MQYKSKIISCLLVICLLFSSLYLDIVPVSAAGSSKIKIRLTVDNRNVSRKTVSIKKGKKKKIRVTVSKKKNAGISFRSNKRSVAAVSKTGKIAAKRIGTAKITVSVKSKEKKYKGWIKVKVVAPKRKNDASLPTKSPVPSPTVMPTDIWATEPTDTPVIEPTDIPTIEPSNIPIESPAPDTGVFGYVSDNAADKWERFSRQTISDRDNEKHHAEIAVIYYNE